MSPREVAARHRRGLTASCAAVLAWTVSFMAALVLLPPGAHTTAVAHADSSAVTKTGPHKWDPATQTFGDTGSVTVDQTGNLTNQVVHVSWTGFTPSTGPAVAVGGVGWQNVLYPVVAYQCRGTNPQITDCYGSSHYGQNPANGFAQPGDDTGLNAPDFPNNEVAAATQSTSAGSLDLEVYTASQSPSLGCDAAHQCSIVVEPNYGGDAAGLIADDGHVDCANHGSDVGPGLAEASGAALSDTDYQYNSTGEECAWNYRTVIPISFAPVAGSCAAGATGVAAEGMPMLDRALSQWVVGACLAGNDPVTVNAASDIAEPQARADFLQSRPGADMAFTSLPADPAAGASRPYTYVPVGNSGITVAFFVDDPTTNLPIKSMKLSPRLVAKLLTQSYDLLHGLKSDIASVAGNPACVFADPEFTALNPSGDGVTWPSCTSVDAASSLPIVAGGKTDLVHELTSWIMSDPDARDFLAGQPDPWNMHVNSFYKTSAYPFPVDNFVPQDSSGVATDPTSGQPLDPQGNDRDYGRYNSFEWNPIQAGLDSVLRHLVTFTATCLGPDYDPLNGGHVKCHAENIGSRGLFAIMDTGRAAAFSLPTASLPNGTGSYVAPSTASMAAAAQDYVTDSAAGTQSEPWGAAHTAYAGDAGAYPLTVPAYAMAPTSGLSDAKAENVATFLTSVTDNRSGQLPGTAPGELAPGFVANTQAQAAQAGAAIAKIRPKGGPGPTVTATGPVTGSPTTSGNVVVTPVTVTTNGTTSVSYLTSTLGGDGTGGVTGSGGSSSKGAAGASGSSGPAHSLSGSTAAAAVGRVSADTAGVGRLILPILLIVGLVLVMAGPAGLVLSSGGAGARLRALWPEAARRFGRRAR